MSTWLPLFLGGGPGGEVDAEGEAYIGHETALIV